MRIPRKLKKKKKALKTKAWLKDIEMCYGYYQLVSLKEVVSRYNITDEDRAKILNNLQ